MIDFRCFQKEMYDRGEDQGVWAGGGDQCVMTELRKHQDGRIDSGGDEGERGKPGGTQLSLKLPEEVEQHDAEEEFAGSSEDEVVSEETPDLFRLDDEWETERQSRLRLDDRAKYRCQNDRRDYGLAYWCVHEARLSGVQHLVLRRLACTFHLVVACRLVAAGVSVCFAR